MDFLGIINKKKLLVSKDNKDSLGIVIIKGLLVIKDNKDSLGIVIKRIINKDKCYY